MLAKNTFVMFGVSANFATPHKHFYLLKQNANMELSYKLCLVETTAIIDSEHFVS